MRPEGPSEGQGGEVCRLVGVYRFEDEVILPESQDHDNNQGLGFTV